MKPVYNGLPLGQDKLAVFERLGHNSLLLYSFAIMAGFPESRSISPLLQSRVRVLFVPSKEQSVLVVKDSSSVD